MLLRNRSCNQARNERMAADQFPLFKLATQIARQMSSPIASRVKEHAKSHPRFGTQVCVRVAHLYRTVEWSARVWTLRLAGTAPPSLRAAKVPPLPRQQAVDLGGDLIGEIVIFGIGSAIIIFEVNRQAAIKEVKVRMSFHASTLFFLRQRVLESVRCAGAESEVGVAAREAQCGGTQKRSRGPAAGHRSTARDVGAEARGALIDPPTSRPFRDSASLAKPTRAWRFFSQST
ncbi:unnamed protein product [Leptosia nina]|uniref:Uncharacterized protein n=1 Tax=Leptosia nina TaxID=320188 RepID=A0AAV1JMN7_9NEOP